MDNTFPHELVRSLETVENYRLLVAGRRKSLRTFCDYWEKKCAEIDGVLVDIEATVRGQQQ